MVDRNKEAREAAAKKAAEDNAARHAKIVATTEAALADAKPTPTTEELNAFIVNNPLKRALAAEAKAAYRTRALQAKSVHVEPAPAPDPALLIPASPPPAPAPQPALLTPAPQPHEPPHAVGRPRGR